jgi:hypothetical protein
MSLICYTVATSTLAVSIALLATPGVADQAAGNACAQTLAVPAALIYQDVLPALTPGSDLRDVVKAHVQVLVKEGKIERAVARTSAEAAGKCLQALRR